MVDTHVKVLVVVMVMVQNVFMVHGHVMDMVIVQAAQMKLIVLLHHVKIKVFGIVAMANVFQHHMYVMDQLIPVTQVGVQTVTMAQMKV
jgi:hypothetical protein